MKLKNKKLKAAAPLVEKAYGKELSERILAAAVKKQEALLAAHPEESKAVRTHTEHDIYPCISLYCGMQEVGVEREEARAFLDRCWSKLAEPKAASMRAMLKIPFLYKLMPRIFHFVTVRQFGEKAGFAATFYDMGKGRCKFDMTKCLYCDVCRREGFPELVPCFCHTDDVTDGNMHRKLLWNRTKIMGDGGDVCDFDLMVLKEPKEK